ncbi:hypothetical protein [Paractinoplanes hotanensis]|uniref:Uncharacterized protein n=1 Tax=Paractinoplanes hotanensis TaxID=2906497 RepID=A0ABT0XXI3_9ACTN|nr:hypothetical protein [Actinoplanes hotanensis]MCM4077912.1 hypothetical protein [Actinoplanes hotanensis]
MDLSPGDVETDLIDLSKLSLAMLYQCDESVLANSVKTLLRQVDRPRVNLGGSGPPVRVD